MSILLPENLIFERFEKNDWLNLPRKINILTIERSPVE